MTTIPPSEYIPALASSVPHAGRYARQLLGIPADADLLPRLTEWLEGGDTATRAAAATALGRLGNQEAYAPLRDALFHPDPRVRSAAVLAQGGLFPDGHDGLISDLRYMLGDDEDDGVRTACVVSLARLCQQQEEFLRVVDNFVLLDDLCPDVQYEAAHGLRRYGVGPVHPSLVMRVLDRPDERVWAECIRACAALQATAAMDGIVQALADGPDTVRQAAAEALGQMGGDAAVEALIAAAYDRSHPHLRTVVESLAALKDARAVPVLAEMLAAPGSTRRRMAARALGKVGGPGAVDALLNALDEPVEEVQDDIMAALGRIGGDRAVPALSRLAMSRGTHRAEVAVRALGATGSAAAVPPLLLALERGSQGRRGQVAEALAAIGSPSAAPYLLAALRATPAHQSERIAGAIKALGVPVDTGEYEANLFHETPRFRVHAGGVLGQLGGQEHVPMLIRAIGDERSGPSAVRALARLGGDEAVSAIRHALLTGGHESVRKSAAEALGSTGGAARAALEQAARDDGSSTVRRAAQHSLDRLEREGA